MRGGKGVLGFAPELRTSDGSALRGGKGVLGPAPELRTPSTGDGSGHPGWPAGPTSSPARPDGAADLQTRSALHADHALRERSSASSFRAPPAGRLMALGLQQPPDHTVNESRLREMSNEASYVLLERLNSDSRIAAERRCKDNHPKIASRCTYEFKIRQARDHTVEETNVSHMSLDHACAFTSSGNRSEAKRLYRMGHHSCAQLCTHDSFDCFTSFPLTFPFKR